MEIAGLLAKDQLQSIFLNLDELTAVNTKFSEKLQDALDIAMEHGDEVSEKILLTLSYNCEFIVYNFCAAMWLGEQI